MQVRESYDSPYFVSPRISTPCSISPKTQFPVKTFLQTTVPRNLISPMSHVSPNPISPIPISPSHVSLYLISPNHVSPNLISSSHVSQNLISSSHVTPNLIFWVTFPRISTRFKKNIFWFGEIRFKEMKFRGNVTLGNEIRENVTRGSVFSGQCAFKKMVHGVLVCGEMKYEELVRGETIIWGNVPNLQVQPYYLPLSVLCLLSQISAQNVIK
jgi:hypothetical protein